MVAFGCWAGIKCFCTKKVHVKMIWKQFLYNFMVLLNGPVKHALFCLMDRYRNVSVGSWQGTAGSQRLELTVANVGTTGYHCKELRVPRGWNAGSQPGNHGLPLQATAGYQRLELMLPNLGTRGYHCKELPVPKGWNWWFPTWEPKVTMARNCRFPGLETYGSQPGNQRLPLQGIAGSQKLEFMFSKLSNYHCKELPVAKAWNSWFQTWKSIRYQWKDLLIPKVKTHGS